MVCGCDLCVYVCVFASVCVRVWLCVCVCGLERVCVYVCVCTRVHMYLGHAVRHADDPERRYECDHPGLGDQALVQHRVHDDKHPLHADRCNKRGRLCVSVCVRRGGSHGNLEVAFLSPFTLNSSELDPIVEMHP